jgi:hypothetical protein
MNPAELNAWMDEHFTRSAFRLETLQTYEVASDGSDYRRYLDGERTWTPERKQPWLDHLASERAHGLHRQRVRIVTRPVTPYTRYECEWGYQPNVAAGEDVRVLDLGDHDLPAGLADSDWWRFDWWLVEDDRGGRRVLGMAYEPDGQFRDAWFADETSFGPRSAAGFVAVRDQLWAAAEPFNSWWNRHGELHRDGAHAA